MFRRFFRKLFRQAKPRVYLGTIAVAPRADFKRYFEDLESLGFSDHDHALTKNLREIFALTPASEIQEPLASDLGLDVIVPNYQAGTFFAEGIGNLPVVFFWRPKIEVRSRLYKLNTGRTVATFSAKEKLPWKVFAKRSVFAGLFAILGVFDSSADISQQDLNYLLERASQRLLMKMVAWI